MKNNYLGQMDNDEHGICIYKEIEDECDLILERIEFWAWWLFAALAITVIIAQLVIRYR